jgi:hypothetical protein
MLRLASDNSFEPSDTIPFPRHLIAGQVRPWRPRLVGTHADTPTPSPYTPTASTTLKPTDSITHAERAMAQVEERVARLLTLIDGPNPGDRPRAA